MELSQTTIELLRDEAYALLCREAVKDGLDRLARERANLIDARPAADRAISQVDRGTLNRALRSALDQETGLRHHLNQIAHLEKRLQDAIRPELHAYLTVASGDYARFATAHKLLEQWQREFAALPERVTAFAHDVRQILQETTASGGRPDLRLFATLRDTALRLEQHATKLDEIGGLLAANVVPGSGISVPVLPDFHRVAWVSSIFLLTAPQLAAETARVETEMRQFLAHDQDAVRIHLKASHEICQCAAENLLQGYWSQLRIHAQIYYVEEREMDVVMEELIRRYLTPDSADNSLACASDPCPA